MELVSARLSGNLRADPDFFLFKLLVGLLFQYADIIRGMALLPNSAERIRAFPCSSVEH